MALVMARQMRWPSRWLTALLLSLCTAARANESVEWTKDLLAAEETCGDMPATDTCAATQDFVLVIDNSYSVFNRHEKCAPLSVPELAAALHDARPSAALPVCALAVGTCSLSSALLTGSLSS